MTNFGTLYQDARKGNWLDAVRAQHGPVEAYRWTVADHCAIAPLLALPAVGARVLDTACGGGARTFALAGVARAVYITDPDPDAVRFVHTRARQTDTHNIRPFLGAPEDAIRPGSLDLIVSETADTTASLNRLVGVLAPGGTLCLGLANTCSMRNRSTRTPGIRYNRLKALMGCASLCNPRIYMAFPNHLDVRLLLDATDRKSPARFLKTHIPGMPEHLPGMWASVLLRLLNLFIAPGYWAIAHRKI